MGRPKGSKNKKKFSELRAEMPVKSQERVAEKTKNMLAELDKVEEPEVSEVVVIKRDSSADKWNAMSVEDRIELIKEMSLKGLFITNPKYPVETWFDGLEEIDTRFGSMIYEVQDKISNYLRKR